MLLSVQSAVEIRPGTCFRVPIDVEKVAITGQMPGLNYVEFMVRASDFRSFLRQIDDTERMRRFADVYWCRVLAANSPHAILCVFQKPGNFMYRWREVDYATNSTRISDRNRAPTADTTELGANIVKNFDVWCADTAPAKRTRECFMQTIRAHCHHDATLHNYEMMWDQIGRFVGGIYPDLTLR